MLLQPQRLDVMALFFHFFLFTLEHLFLQCSILSSPAAAPAAITLSPRKHETIQKVSKEIILKPSALLFPPSAPVSHPEFFSPLPAGEVAGVGWRRVP